MRTIINEEKNYSIQLKPVKNECEYHFYQGDNQLKILTGKIPIALTDRMPIWKHILEYSKASLYNSEMQRQIMNNEIIPALQEQYNNIIFEKANNEKQNIKKEERNRRKQIKNGKKLYESIDNPLHYIRELCDWTSAGESRNILFALNAYISQVCLKSGINVIIEGDAANGKDHIRRTAFQFLPEGIIIMEKNVTQAVIFRRSEEDVRFYDGKIVYYGDMGGTSDKENMEGSINLMKELQTEHYLNKPTNISEEGGWNVVDLTLEGTPSVTFTTVPNAVLDTQILSRGVTLMPRNDNKREFFTFKAFMDFKGKEWRYVQNVINPALDSVKDMITYLCKISEDLIIINPYFESLQNLLKDSVFYKRDYDKYRNLLYSITLLNSANNITEYDGKNYLAVSSKDLRLYSELINDYVDIASSNLTKGAMKVLEEFNKLDSTLQGAEELPVVESDFELTKDEFRKRSSLDYAKSSVDKYFTELVQGGYLEVSDDSNKKNKYLLTKKGAKKTGEVNLFLESHWENINIPLEVKQDLMNKDVVDHDIKLFDNNYSIFEKPPWKDKKTVMEFTRVIVEED